MVQVEKVFPLQKVICDGKLSPDNTRQFASVIQHASCVFISERDRLDVAVDDS